MEEDALYEGERRKAGSSRTVQISFPPTPPTVPVEPEKQQRHRGTRNATPRAPARHARSPDRFPAFHLQLILPFFLPDDA